MSHRLDKNGKPAIDALVNEKAQERKILEQEERRKLESEAAEPFSRQKVEKVLLMASKDDELGVVNGEPIRGSANLSGLDLSGLDLSGLDLSKANLEGANLSGANMTGCRLVGANLHKANLTGALLENMNAVQANFSQSCLCSAKAAKTHFMGANLSECCYEDTDGVDVVEKPLTAAEEKKARHMQSEGFRVNILFDEKEQGNAKAVYVGATLEKANVTGMSQVCLRRTK